MNFSHFFLYNFAEVIFNVLRCKYERNDGTSSKKNSSLLVTRTNERKREPQRSKEQQKKRDKYSRNKETRGTRERKKERERIKITTEKSRGPRKEKENLSCIPDEAP